MLAGAHLIFGNAIALKLTQEPLAAFFIGLISHHIGDFLPHIDSNIFESETKQEFKNIREWPLKLWILFLFELTAGIFMLLYFGEKIIAREPRVVLFASIGALFPDILCAIIPKNTLNKFKPTRLYLNFHQSFHYRVKNFSTIGKILVGALEGLVILMSALLLS